MATGAFTTLKEKNTRAFITLKEKKTIVTEAYSVPGNIKKTSRKYNVAPSNIRCWKKNFIMDDARNAQLEDTTNTISRGDIICAHKKKTRHK